MASEERIRQLAYKLWEQDGCPDGKDQEHYYKAQRIIAELEASGSQEGAEQSGQRAGQSQGRSAQYAAPAESRQRRGNNPRGSSRK